MPSLTPGFRTGITVPLVTNILAVSLLVVTIGLGAVVLPKLTVSVELLQASNAPARLTELRLPAVVTHERIAAEIGEAVGKGDVDLARSFLELADTQGVGVHDEQRARINAAATAPDAASSFVDGIASGNAETWAGSAGSITADLVGISDVRDLWQEGGKLVRDEPYDGVIFGLSAAGLALTGVTVASFLPSGGTTVTAKGPLTRGLTLLKGARRAGLLSRGLVQKFGGMVLAAVDKAALKEALAAVRALDLTTARLAARNTIRPGALRAISGMGADVVRLEARVGQRGAAQALGVARDARELSRARRLAEALGGRTRAALKLLGSAALILGDILAVVVQAVLLATGWLMTAALTARRLGSMIGRLL